MDLSKTIKINSSYEISYGMLLMTGLITFFEVLGIIAFNNWALHPSVFFLVANAFLTIRKQAQDDKMDEVLDRLEKVEKLQGK